MNPPSRVGSRVIRGHARSRTSDAVFGTPGLVVAWAPNAARSASLAAALDLPCYLIHVLAFQRPWLAPLKYPMQAALTWALLWRERPAAIIVQNPPLPAVVCVALYSWRYQARFIIDSHSGALVEPKWAWSRPMQRWLGRRATATLVHTTALLPRLGGAGRVLVIEDGPLAPREPGRSAPTTPRVVVVGSLAADEPLEAVVAAAEQLSPLRFVLTGDPRRAAWPDLLRELPANVELAGWLSTTDYALLLQSATVIVSLTTRDLTVLRGAWEAVYLGKPLVTSDWPAQRDCFTQGTIFVDNTAASLAEGLRRALVEQEGLAEAMRSLEQEKRHAWDSALSTLCSLLTLARPHTRPEVER